MRGGLEGGFVEPDECLDAYEKQRAIATKTAAGRHGTRDGLGRRIEKPHGLGGRR